VNEKSVKKFKCELCDYSCEKLTTLKKHNNSKHTEQKCKICSKEFRTAMDLIIHVSKEHQEQEGERDAPLQSTPKSNMEGKISDFELDELLLGEYL